MHIENQNETKVIPWVTQKLFEYAQAGLAAPSPLLEFVLIVLSLPFYYCYRDYNVNQGNYHLLHFHHYWTVSCLWWLLN